jgi:hypothetical protein
MSAQLRQGRHRLCILPKRSQKAQRGRLAIDITLLTELAAFQAYRFKTSPQPRCVICVVSQLKAAASSSSNSDDERHLEFGLVLEKLHERSGAATGV